LPPSTRVITKFVLVGLASGLDLLDQLLALVLHLLPELLERSREVLQQLVILDVLHDVVQAGLEGLHGLVDGLAGVGGADVAADGSGVGLPSQRLEDEEGREENKSDASCHFVRRCRDSTKN
jgi:hypothetical protein